MGLEQEIESIQVAIRAGRFPNEASVSQGVVLRLLNGLGWPTYDTQVVWPEYSLSGRRVDYGLCHPPGRAIAFIEVKQIGLSDGAERQLFEYAFHEGVPMAILTDGREWNFFLPGEQGSYGERRVYKLDIVERDISESARRLERYLLHSAVMSGEAIHAAREDYRNVSRERQMAAALPTAWSQIISDEDELLLEIVADRVESLCGFKPDPDMVACFLKGNFVGRPTAAPGMATNRASALSTSICPAAQTLRSLPQTMPGFSTARDTSLQRPIEAGSQIGFTLHGTFHPARNAIDALRQVFETLTQRDPSFPERFASLPKHGRTRRFLARDAAELYPGRPDLARDCSIELSSGWWLSTNHSRQSIARIVSMASEVSRLGPEHELVAHLGE